METQVKEIIAPFIGIGAEEIVNDTPLNKNALKSSIHLHRMYAKLASGGYAIKDYSNIETFASLLTKLGNKSIDSIADSIIPINEKMVSSGVGIDIV